MSEQCDLLVIGGGINGTAIARAASVAGLDVVLVERRDLASATSSASTKLIHGGLRYLEQREFGLVRESLKERTILLRTACHIVEPQEFLLMRRPDARPWLMLRAGLWLYDLLALGGPLPRSRSVAAPNGSELSYWDARVDDSRLVVLNALDAAEHGARVFTRSCVTNCVRHRDLWHVEVERAGGGKAVFSARALVNAAGPWVGSVLAETLGQVSESRARLVRGSHLVLRRRPEDGRARLLQMSDGRIVFLIPYQQDYTLVGTTDTPVSSPEDAEPGEEEIDYLLRAAESYWREPVSRADIVWKFGGIRALYDDGSRNPSKVTRDYHLEVDRSRMLLSVFGGKLTTARALADRALAALGLPAGPTQDRPLPGGDISSFPAHLRQVRMRWPFLGDARSLRMARAYGSRMWTLMRDVVTEDDLGVDLGKGLSEREVRYLHDFEWARCAEDVLWRRTKLGLAFSPEQIAILDDYMRGLVP